MKTGSMFCGIGGIDLAFERAGFETVWANEIDSEACKTYRFNFPENHLVEGDIKTIDKQSIPYIDVLTAGFPCQPFSVCGLQRGFEDDRGNLFFQILDVIDAKHPAVVFLENVANLVDHDYGKTFNTIHNELTCRDYYIRYMVADACDYGVPQHRTRTYIVAFENIESCNRFVFPEKSKEHRFIFDVIDKTKQKNESFYLNKEHLKYQKIHDAIIDDEQIYRFSDYGIQASKDGISFTLKANMGTWYNRVPIIKDNYGIREITPEECLSLMGFPQSFAIPETVALKEAYKQIGNSVCVPVVSLLARQIKAVL